jgi:hypothetical protein
MGQKRKWRRFQVMSALPHKADINARDCDVRFVPQADVRRVNAALAFLVRNRSQTAPQNMKDLFLSSGAVIQGDRMKHRNLLMLVAGT